MHLPAHPCWLAAQAGARRAQGGLQPAAARNPVRTASACAARSKGAGIRTHGSASPFAPAASPFPSPAPGPPSACHGARHSTHVTAWPCEDRELDHFLRGWGCGCGCGWGRGGGGCVDHFPVRQVEGDGEGGKSARRTWAGRQGREALWPRSPMCREWAMHRCPSARRACHTAPPPTTYPRRTPAPSTSATRHPTIPTNSCGAGRCRGTEPQRRSDHLLLWP